MMSPVKLYAVAGQVAGVAAIVAAVWLLAGFAWALLLVGVGAVALGTLAELGALRQPPAPPGRDE